jgi:hypothetical protein
VKDYPVESELMPKVKERITLALQIHDCDRQLTKENSARRWWIKMSKECDLIISDEEDSRSVNVNLLNLLCSYLEFFCYSCFWKLECSIWARC